MGTCVIFCAAEFTELIQPIGREDLVIAADGGLQHTNKLDIRPDIILGDFDSLGYTRRGPMYIRWKRTTPMPCWQPAGVWSWDATPFIFTAVWPAPVGTIP